MGLESDSLRLRAELSSAEHLAIQDALDRIARAMGSETPMIDLTASYTFTTGAEPTTITPVVKRRTTRHTGPWTFPLYRVAIQGCPWYPA
ncbi:hypothetical protein ABZV77_09900 [Streptomyces sp. NPDC004732]|uniref:hypothetical protein n=1 Tax=Streptomyces sp. NPDC004732 TaxID=3154290 RepID=UPI0033B84DA8